MPSVLPAEVAKTIRSLDKKIRELEETKRRLIETFGVPVSVSLTASPTLRQSAVARINVTQIPTRGRVASSENSRIFEAYLKSHGPASTAEIAHATSIPRGSINWLMKKSGGRIRRREDGRIELAS